MNLKILMEFALQVEIEAYNIQDIYDMNLKRLAQSQQTTRATTKIVSFTTQHSSLQITNQVQPQISKFMQDDMINMQCNIIEFITTKSRVANESKANKNSM